MNPPAPATGAVSIRRSPHDPDIPARCDVIPARQPLVQGEFVVVGLSP